jgi:outer membrane phospholipase A
MSTVSIDDKNAFIAKFMGYKRVTVGYSGTEEETGWQRDNEQWMNKVGITMVGHYYVDVDNDEWVHCEDVNYDKSWDALMPVVEKIEAMEWCIRIENWPKKFKSPYKELYSVWMWLDPEECPEIQTYSDSKIEAVYNAVYQFITWYNSQKP